MPSTAARRKYKIEHRLFGPARHRVARRAEFARGAGERRGERGIERSLGGQRRRAPAVQRVQARRRHGVARAAAAVTASRRRQLAFERHPPVVQSPRAEKRQIESPRRRRRVRDANAQHGRASDGDRRRSDTTRTSHAATAAMISTSEQRERHAIRQPRQGRAASDRSTRRIPRSTIGLRQRHNVGEGSRATMHTTANFITGLIIS